MEDVVSCSNDSSVDTVSFITNQALRLVMTTDYCLKCFEYRKVMAAPAARLPPLPALRDFIHMYRLKAKKILSQNYIMDMNINRKIARSAGVTSQGWAAEIGPGPGGITRALLETGCKRLDVVELDHRFIPPLEHLSECALGRMFIHQGDILKTDIGKIWSDAPERPDLCSWYEDPPPLNIVGNLPFNVATPLIIKYLREMSYRTGPWRFGRVPLTLTFQLEVARRICSPLASDDRSRISVMAQYVAEPKIVFTISGSSFVPRPDVDVGVVRFVPRIEPLAKTAFEVMEKVCRQVFHYRQKYMIKGLKTLYPPELADELSHNLLRRFGIDPTMTSTRLGVEQFADLAKGYEQQCLELPGLFLYDYTKPKRTVAQLSAEPNALPPRLPQMEVAEQTKKGVSLRDFDKYAHVL